MGNTPGAWKISLRRYGDDAVGLRGVSGVPLGVPSVHELVGKFEKVGIYTAQRQRSQGSEVLKQQPGG